MLRTLFVLPFIFLFTNASFAQGNAPDAVTNKISNQNLQSVNWTIGGQISMSTDFKQNIFLNFAGPGLKLADKSKKSPWAVSINMFPSMRCNTQEKDSNKIFTPILGAGFQIFYKRLVISMPSYYISAQNIWVGTLGLGYSF